MSLCRTESLESNAQWKGLALGNEHLICSSVNEDERVCGSDGSGWVYGTVQAPNAVFPVKEKSSDEGGDWVQVLVLKQRKIISGHKEMTIGSCLIIWLFYSVNCPLWLMDMN